MKLPWKKLKIPWKPWMKLPRKPWKYFEKSWKPTKNHVTTLKNQHTGMFWQTNRQAHSVFFFLFYKDHVSLPIMSICTVALLPVLLIRLPFWSNDYQRSFTKLALKIQIENLRQISIMSFFRAFKCFSWGQSTNGVTLEYNCKPDKPRRTTQYRLPTEKNRVFYFVLLFVCMSDLCVSRAPLLYFIRSWVALSFKVCQWVSESVSKAFVTPD